MRRVLEQRLERPEAGHLVEDFGDEVGELLGVERQPLGHHVLRDQRLDVGADLVLGQFFQRREVDLLDQPAMQPHLGVEQLVAEQRIGGAATGSGGLSAGTFANSACTGAVRPRRRPTCAQARQSVGL